MTELPDLPMSGRAQPAHATLAHVAVDRVAVLLSIQRALWEQVTPNLRGVAVAWRSAPGDQSVTARFLYEKTVGELERECTSLAETYCIADFPSQVKVSFLPIENGSLDLLPGEEWIYLRWEPTAELPNQPD